MIIRVINHTEMICFYMFSEWTSRSLYRVAEWQWTWFIE